MRATRGAYTREDRVLTVGETAEKLMVALRDGRKLIGVLRSWDQFGWFSSLTLMNLEGGRTCEDTVF